MGAPPVSIHASDLAQALVTGTIDTFIASSVTGYDAGVWEALEFFRDTQV